MKRNQAMHGEHHDKHTARHRYFVASLMLVLDIIFAAAAYFLALWLRFDARIDHIDTVYLETWLHFLPFFVVGTIVIFWLFHLYHSLWRFASMVEFRRIVCAVLISGILHAVATVIFFERMPLSYYILGMVLQFLFVLSSRFAYRIARLFRDHRRKKLYRAAASRVMLIGAGAAGNIVLRELHNAKEINECVCCIIDDNESKWGRSMEGVPVVGGRNDILYNVQKYKIEKIYLTMPSASAIDRRDILNICKETHCQLKTLPGVYEMVAEGGAVKALKEVAVEDLLGREPVKVNMDEIFAFIKGKVVLVTGGGGSIGSELCRQIAQHEPKQLIVFDIYTSIKQMQRTFYDISVFKMKCHSVIFIIICNNTHCLKLNTSQLYLIPHISHHFHKFWLHLLGWYWRIHIPHRNKKPFFGCYI